MGLIYPGIPKDITVRLAQLAGASTFIETGTHHAQTTKWAAEFFKTVHTIEKAQVLYDMHADTLNGMPGVTAHLGDSSDFIPKIVGSLDESPAVYWLDGHWSGGETAGEDNECPLAEELAPLKTRPQDIILIDDARFFLSVPPEPHNPSHWPTITDIALALLPEDESKKRFVQIVDDVIFVVPKDGTLDQEVIRHGREVMKNAAC